MVYCGKPSKGCGQCRSRKIKCDQGRPACWQCTRMGRECSGYRDELSLMFRDESESVRRKAGSSPSPSATSASGRKTLSRSPRPAFPGQKAASVATSGSTTSIEDIGFDFDSNSEHRFLTGQARQSPLGMHPTTSLSRQEAVCFFLQSHAIPGTLLMTDALTHFLMQSGGSLAQQAIQSSIVAVASAMLARVRNDASLRQEARREYGATLRLVNKTLADTNEAKTNQALGAVVLLSLYEIVTSRTPQGIEAWTNHIHGAAALLEHRGIQQLQTEVGIRLFLHLRYQIIISCLQRDVRVPSSLLESSKLDIIPQLKDALGNKLIMIIGNLSNLRANIHSKAFNNPQEVLSAACALEADLVSWMAALPPDFTYSSHTLMPLDRNFEHRCRGIRPYNNEYHIYPDIWAPSCWNHYRCARILVSEIILSHVHMLSDSSPNYLSEDFRLHCKSLRSTISRLGADICRSVPFHLGACSSEILPETPMLPSESYLGGLMLLWPLFIAGIIEGPTHPQRRWVIKCLKTIGNSCGLDQALATMDLLTVDPGMFYSAEKYGEAADTPTGSSELLPVSIFHIPYYELPALKEYRELRASSA
ncbi:hypothetical protein BGW36DRAFT_430199 [Talaromyces proteolyticus]|uniref:Zn(2)-C6 fungal-type domain-containing protein n=1 Tax=Talaromyces proteolyticus TaxID=1131652 RepID=A0AAD4PYE3_9EURO|nr:uncharacterized protein BGW36DRAFT_430199 [Talaromyces proteolyticus]KAH8694179.1 hypothetical protein BGW36DRAFT_430199 [Talaromyces proteolyticus]